MLGYQRRMYFVKDTRSRLFREAYFVMREGVPAERVCENDLAAEADRILREHFSRRKAGHRWRRYLPAVSFIAGAMFGIAAGWIII